MNIEDIKTVLIVGSGTMGQQIGFQCAVSGFDVIMYDIAEEMLATAAGRLEKLAKNYKAGGRLTGETAAAARGRITMTTDPRKAGANADFVSESVPEDPKLKAKVFAQFNEICPAHAIFTTNTSSLIPSMIAAQTGRPERFAAFHFHDVRVTRIVDIMPHPGTSPEVTALIEAFALKIGQIPIMLKKENFGYVFNAMIMELFKSAQALAANGVASVEDIDRAWMGVMHTPTGPFGIMDSIGIDTVWKVTDYWAKIVKDPQQTKNAAFMKPYVDQGFLGEKTGRGFYAHPHPAYAAPDFVTGVPGGK
ncbi:MAG: 3-hydroxybutyryl-CoA dehydrogenase [Desulfobacterales bacterium CG23_combo_of_CG06-09_8_20_14_all_51_8]|nr:MAG: 3-hydroxybutyryl-CoA dehydrogenase [Desulfobacterales bacterium CG23_combo_of_CG06-09_8_20_14_all_51_8]